MKRAHSTCQALSHVPPLLIAGVMCLAVFSPATSQGCAACYGQSDSPLAAGMNWGILSLLGFIGFVLGGVAGFFLFLARRSAALRANARAVERFEFELPVGGREERGIGRQDKRHRNLARHPRNSGSFWALAPLGRKRCARFAGTSRFSAHQ